MQARAMKVTRVGATKETSSAKRKSKSPGDNVAFADNLRETQGSQSAAVVPDATAVSAADAVLATQSVGDNVDDSPQRRRLMEFADDILDKLDELRLGILMGRFSKEKLADLAQRLRQKRQQSADPRLNEIIQEVELRAEVEIAKYSRRPKSDLA